MKNVTFQSPRIPAANNRLINHLLHVQDTVTLALRADIIGQSRRDIILRRHQQVEQHIDGVRLGKPITGHMLDILQNTYSMLTNQLINDIDIHIPTTESRHDNQQEKRQRMHDRANCETYPERLVQQNGFHS